MAINKATLAKEVDGVIEYIYPKTSGDIVVYDETHSVSAKIAELENGKVGKIEGKSLSTNDFTDALKNKLDGIDESATKTVVDDALSNTSTNAIQNKVVAEELKKVNQTVDEAIDGINFENSLGLTIRDGKLCCVVK